MYICIYVYIYIYLYIYIYIHIHILLSINELIHVIGPGRNRIERKVGKRVRSCRARRVYYTTSPDYETGIESGASTKQLVLNTSLVYN